MTLSENAKLVKNWISSGRNYNDGTTLYCLIGKNAFLKRDFPGKAHKYSGKLFYELCKCAGLDHTSIHLEQIPDKLVPFNSKDPEDLKPHRINFANLPAADQMPETFSDKNETEYPPIIRRIISQYAETFQERSKTHRIMCELPESNARSVKIKRAELFSIIKSLSERLSVLFLAREEYIKTGKIPSQDSIFPMPSNNPEPTLPDDLIELKKKKKNLQSSNSKDQNRLEYQSIVQTGGRNPMPHGPKRLKIENHIKARTKLIEEIDYKINSLNAI